MKVDFEKIHRIRKQRKITVKGFCELSGIGRTTLWDWEHGKGTPDEYKIRKMAKALGISVTDISDIPEEYDIPGGYSRHIKKNVSGLFHILYEENSNKEVLSIKNQLDLLEKQLVNASVIIKAFMSSLRSIVYIKELSGSYIIANNAFLKNISLKDGYDVVGKKDHDFFSVKESRDNETEDIEVIKSGEAVVNREGYIPGTRKKKWGLISKYPILSPANIPIGMIAVISDITESRLAAKRKVILEKALDSIEDSCISIGRFTNDFSHRFIFEYINTQMKDIFSLENESDFGKIPELWNEMLPEESKKIFERRRYTDTFPAHFVYTAVRPKDKKKVILQDSVYKSEDRLISIVRDITEKQENLKDLKAFDFIFKSLPLAIEIYDSNKALVYSNSKTKTVFGYNDVQVADFNFFLKQIVHPDDRKRFSMTEENYYPESGYRVIKPNGQTVQVKSTCVEELFLDKRYCIVTHTAL